MMEAQKDAEKTRSESAVRKLLAVREAPFVAGLPCPSPVSSHRPLQPVQGARFKLRSPRKLEKTPSSRRLSRVDKQPERPLCTRMRST